MVKLHDAICACFLTCILSFAIGVLVGICVGHYEMQGLAVEAGVAHYDSKTAEFVWGNPDEKL